MVEESAKESADSRPVLWMRLMCDADGTHRCRLAADSLAYSIRNTKSLKSFQKLEKFPKAWRACNELSNSAMELEHHSVTEISKRRVL